MQAVARRTNGSTANGIGNAIAQDSAQALIHTPRNDGASPRPRQLLMMEKVKDSSRAGLYGGGPVFSPLSC